jgi:hypothetical protein
MNDTKQIQRVAYIAAALFAVRLLSFFVPDIRDATAANSPLLGELNALLGIAPHLLLFAVVAALPAPEWARAAGYGWLVVDIATDIMDLNGVPYSIYITLKYGGHISAALWIAVVSWRTSGAMRIVGLLLALDLFSFSFIASFTQFLPLLPALVLLPLWFALGGRLLGQVAEYPPPTLDSRATGSG